MLVTAANLSVGIKAFLDSETAEDVGLEPEGFAKALVDEPDLITHVHHDTPLKVLILGISIGIMAEKDRANGSSV